MKDNLVSYRRFVVSFFLFFFFSFFSLFSEQSSFRLENVSPLFRSRFAITIIGYLPVLQENYLNHTFDCI